MDFATYITMTALGALMQLMFIFAGAFLAAVGWSLGRKLVG